jgi:hypothetical protein
MATEKQPPHDPENGSNLKYLETVETADEKHVEREGADYSGAVKKTSPEEIALVRKLDFRIMPTLWAMYFLNYVSLFAS